VDSAHFSIKALIKTYSPVLECLYIMKFKYAPISSVGVERSFLTYKMVLAQPQVLIWKFYYKHSYNGLCYNRRNMLFNHHYLFTFIHLLHIHQIHIRFNKPTGYRICHQIIPNYKIYMQHNSFGSLVSHVVICISQFLLNVLATLQD
jgi:hypothetical protein